MEILFTIILVFAFIFPLYAFLLAGRKGNLDADKFMHYRYAHRGLHDKPTIPENSMIAFLKAAEKGYAIELDVHLMRDGNIAVIHDSSLKRTTGYDIKIEDLETKELKKFKLGESHEYIPTLDEVLSEINGRVPLLIEIKTESNAKRLTKAVVEKLAAYKGDYCIESFDPRVIAWLRSNSPETVRGQITQNFFKNRNGLTFFTCIILTTLLFNCITRPDFISVNYHDLNLPQIKIALKLLRIRGFVWTVKNKEALENFEQDGYAVIFENFKP